MVTLILAIGFVSGEEISEVLVVDSNSFADLKTLIDSSDDVIYLNSTVYSANSNRDSIEINKNITIDGGYKNNPELISTLDAKGLCSVFTINPGSSVTLRNLVFINGFDSTGGAIYSNGNLTVYNCVFENNAASMGGAAICSLTNLVVVNSIFNNNSNGKYASIWTLGNVTVEKSNFTLNRVSNPASCGAAVACTGNLKISECNFINNFAFDNGGAVYGIGSTLIVKSKFSANHANNGSAVHALGNLTVLNTFFENNVANGTAAVVGRGNLILNNSIFKNNTNGGIYTYYLNCENSDFIGESGENVIMCLADINVTDCQFKANVVSGATIHAENTTNITNCQFRDDECFSEILITSTGNFTNNTFDGGVLPIFMDGGVISSPMTLTFKNSTGLPNSITQISAVLKDLDGNVIGSSRPVKAVINHRNLILTFDKKEFVANYTTTAEIANYTITGIYDGEGNCSVVNGLLKVGNYVKTNIVSSDLLKYFQNASDLKFKLTTENGTALANQKINISINGESYTRTTDINGSNKFVVKLPAGHYEVVLTYDGEDPYLPTSTTVYVEVLPLVGAKNLVKYFCNGSQFVVSVYNKDGSFAAGKKVEFNVNGVFYTRTVRENGSAMLDINLPAGEYVITSIFEGFETSNNITVLSVLDTHNLVMYQGNGSEFVVKVVDGSGRPLSGATLSFNINGVFYHRVSDESGTAKLQINLPPGTYIITTVCNGAILSNNVTILPVIISKNLKMFDSERSPFNVTILNGSGNPLGGANLTFNINGVFYNRTTNENGSAKLDINLPVGDYTITTMYGNFVTSNTIAIRD